jgi:hypothetical protein
MVWVPSTSLGQNRARRVPVDDVQGEGIDPSLELRSVQTIAYSCVLSWGGVFTSTETLAAETVNPYLAAGGLVAVVMGAASCVAMTVVKAFMPANSPEYKLIDPINGVISSPYGLIFGVAGA